MKKNVTISEVPYLLPSRILRVQGREFIMKHCLIVAIACAALFGCAEIQLDADTSVSPGISFEICVRNQ